MSLTASRRAARQVLSDVRSREAWAHDVLAARLSRSGMIDSDTAFATRLVYGTLATQGTLDEALDRHLDRPGRVHPLVRDALRLAAYEILFMRTPARVAVHQGVDSVREVAGGAAGLANAVLRRLSEEAEAFPWGDPATDLAALARLTGHPLWLAELLVRDLGLAAAREMMEADLEPAPLYLAHNPFVGDFAQLMARLVAEGVDPQTYGPGGCIVAGSPAAAVRGDSLASGACVVADAAAQFVASLSAPPPGGSGVDIAAGRGTKTLLMQASSLRQGGVATLLAADIHSFKTELLARRMEELGVPDVRIVVADCTDESAVEVLGGPASADAVLVDAPCSGLGTLRRHPEKRWRLSPQDIPAVAAVGAAMLTTASRLVRPGGFVVYSTCTVTESENTAVVRGFLENAAGEGFFTRQLGSTGLPGWEPFVTSEGWFASRPRIGGPDGHFAAVLQRQ